MTPTANISDLLFLAAIVFGLLFTISIRRRREAIRYRIRLVIVAEASFIGATYLLTRAGQPMAVSAFLGTLAGAIVIHLSPRRSRYVPTTVRRKAVAKWELKSGKKFNPQKHELDHEVPFSRGGSNTLDNIRVSSRKRNRSKGAKSPWWDLLGR